MKARLRKLSSRLPLMIVSLLMAFLLWLLVIAEEKIEAGFMVPLVFDSIPATVVIDGAPMGSVYVQIRGSKQAVENIIPQQIQARVDLSQAQPGDEFVQITHQSIVLPKNIDVLGVYPPYLDLKFLAKRPVPVRVRTVGKPSDGYMVKEIVVIPRQVEIVGPLHRVDAIRRVDTYPVDIDGQKTSLQVKATFAQPGDDVRLLQLKPTEVTIHIAARELERTFGGVPVGTGGREATLSSGTVAVVVKGAYPAVKALKKEDLSVEVDWEAAGEKPSVLPLRVKAPPGISVLSWKPREVKLK